LAAAEPFGNLVKIAPVGGWLDPPSVGHTEEDKGRKTDNHDTDDDPENEGQVTFFLHDGRIWW